MTPDAWVPGPSAPRLHRGEVHVWLADLAAWDEAELVDLLAPAELTRAARIVRPAARSHWARARGLLRLLLGRYLELGPADIQLAAARTGRPYVETGPRFSLAHSGWLAAYALTQLDPVGIDIEVLRPLRKDVLARRLASTGVPVDVRAPAADLLTHWTRYEAAIKCADAAAWVASLDLDRDAVAALATSVRPARLRLWRLDASRDTAPDSPLGKRRGRPTGAPI